MNRKPCLTWSLVLAVAALGACSSEKPAKDAAQTGVVMHRVKGKLQAAPGSTGADTALNAGGKSIFIRSGLQQYRLFLKSAVEITPDMEYEAEGIYAQKAIDEIGDPDQGKQGYPLAASCKRVIRMAWGNNISMDVADGHASLLRTQINRRPARPIFLVTKLTPVADGSGKQEVEKDLPSVTVPAAKQSALRLEGATVQPAPLWAPEGGVVHCKVVIDEKGKIAGLDTGVQLCEAVPWGEFRYTPLVQGGKPVRAQTEVEVRFEPRK